MEKRINRVVNVLSNETDHEEGLKQDNPNPNDLKQQLQAFRSRLRLMKCAVCNPERRLDDITDVADARNVHRLRSLFPADINDICADVARKNPDRYLYALLKMQQLIEARHQKSFQFFPCTTVM